MITLGEMMAHARDVEARRSGVSEADIALARQAGMLPADVAALRAFTAGAPGWCVVVRCPKEAAYAWQGLFAAKIGAVSKKSGDSGVVSIQKLRRTATGAPIFRDGEPMIDATVYVSDYDMMGVWQHWRGEWQRMRITATDGAKRGSYGAEAAEMLRRLNRTLTTKIQHGCQDDWASSDNRGVKDDDAFAGFRLGEIEFLRGAAACRSFYAKHGLGTFPYHPQTGAYTG